MHRYFHRDPRQIWDLGAHIASQGKPSSRLIYFTEAVQDGFLRREEVEVDQSGEEEGTVSVLSNRPVGVQIGHVV